LPQRLAFGGRILRVDACIEFRRGAIEGGIDPRDQAVLHAKGSGDWAYGVRLRGGEYLVRDFRGSRLKQAIGGELSVDESKQGGLGMVRGQGTALRQICSLVRGSTRLGG